jgi:hypothetical protein
VERAALVDARHRPPARRDAARFGKSYFDAGGLATRYLDAGDQGRAIEFLDKAYDIHDPMLPYIGIPLWDPLRADPRFQALVRRVGLPQ